MTSPRSSSTGSSRRVLLVVGAALVALLCAAGVVRVLDGSGESEGAPAAAPSRGGTSSGGGAPSGTASPGAPPEPVRPGRIFDRGRFLVAYYGTSGTGALGVLGETTPEQMHRRLTRAAAAFERPAQPVQEVFELIVTIADPTPGPDGDFAHDIARADVQRYIDAAHRHDALLVLDIQPGRTDFLTAAKRWAWALRDPYVGLALDPEWRMGRGEVPGRVIGSVDAAEVNAVSRWLAQLQERHDLPEKLFVLHQFRREMITRIGSVQPRPSLAMVQHVDGFGTPGQKLATYDHVARPRKFTMGFKLFYDEDVPRMTPDAVHRVRPKVRFVSFQ